MEVVQVLHMNGGIDETSYASNSLIQKKVISLTKHISEEAITNLYCSTLPRSLAIADLGCSSGPNTLFLVSELIKVPEGLDNNKGNIYMACTSPPDVLRAYYEQYQRDFSMFLKCRAEELVAGGGMVLTFLGRRSEDPSSRECCYIWELLAMALNDMVSEGLIDEDKMNSFNIPQYTPSPSEVKTEVSKQGYFSIDHLEVSAIKWNDFDNEFNASNAFSDDGYKVAKYMRAVADSMLVSHFGDGIIDEVFLRYGKIIADRISKENCQFINVTISITKIG
ncbi:hypothetical protein SO802_029708 [Lithocarpus litseifolius]|uniref:Uncharacterized protein n=1 Tax=Lithocarpus litseifolius TaxID=425828 RepID=A0AAW2BU42_9ROSI